MGQDEENQFGQQMAELEAEVMGSLIPDDGDERTVWERLQARLLAHPLMVHPDAITEDDLDQIITDTMAITTDAELRILLGEWLAPQVAEEVARYKRLGPQA